MKLDPKGYDFAGMNSEFYSEIRHDVRCYVDFSLNKNTRQAEIVFTAYDYSKRNEIGEFIIKKCSDMGEMMDFLENYVKNISE